MQCVGKPAMHAYCIVCWEARCQDLGMIIIIFNYDFLFIFY